MSRSFRLTLAALAALSLSTRADALEVLLINGKRIDGSVTVSRKTVSVHAGTTTYHIPRGSVRAVRLEARERIACEKQRAKLGISADAHVAFAEWLEARYQYVEAEKTYEAALVLDADHPRARRALGYRRVDGKWTRTNVDRWRVQSAWLGPEGAEACYQLAQHYNAAGEKARVEPLLRQALIAQPTHAGTLAMMRPITDAYRSKNDYRLPVEGLWGVIHDFNNHHRKAAYMAYALDFMKLDDNRRATRVTPPTKVEDYYTWDAPIHAAADGEVYAVNEGYADNPLGRWHSFHSANTVCIRHAHGEYTVYGHLRKGSITVKKGDKVKAGQIVGRGGNSGSSGWPHMHFAMYDRDGIGLPCTFVDFTHVTRDAETHVASGRAAESNLYRNRFVKTK